MYGILNPRLDNQILHNVFSTQDPVFHADLKRTIGSLYTLAAVSEYEFHIDSCIQLFLSRIRDFTQHQSAIIDMSAWLQYYAFDSLGQINFSRTLGFLATGTDVDGICKLDHKQMMYFASVRSRCSEPNTSFMLIQMMVDGPSSRTRASLVNVTAVDWSEET